MVHMQIKVFANYQDVLLSFFYSPYNWQAHFICLQEKYALMPEVKEPINLCMWKKVFKQPLALVPKQLVVAQSLWWIALSSIKYLAAVARGH